MTTLAFIFGAFGLWLLLYSIRTYKQAVDEERTRREDLEWRIFYEYMQRARR